MEPKEYIAICGSDDLIWTALTGTSETKQEEEHKGLIWSSLIHWSSP